MSTHTRIFPDLRSAVTPTLRLHRANKPQLGPCLLVSRETGAGGGEIAEQAAQRLDWHLLDKQILDELSSRYGTPQSVLNVVDEKNVGWLADIFNGWSEGHGFSQLAYVHRLHRLFDAVARQGHVVIVGRGARFVLPRSACFSVRIVAPIHYRVERVAARHGLSTSEARDWIERADEQQVAFVTKYHHQNVADPRLHDIVVNVEQLGTQNTLDIVVDAVQSWLEVREFPTARTDLMPA